MCKRWTSIQDHPLAKAKGGGKGGGYQFSRFNEVTNIRDPREATNIVWVKVKWAAKTCHNQVVWVEVEKKGSGGFLTIMIIVQRPLYLGWLWKKIQFPREKYRPERMDNIGECVKMVLWPPRVDFCPRSSLPWVMTVCVFLTLCRMRSYQFPNCDCRSGSLPRTHWDSATLWAPLASRWTQVNWGIPNDIADLGVAEGLETISRGSDASLKIWKLHKLELEIRPLPFVRWMVPVEWWVLESSRVTKGGKWDSIHVPIV